MIYLEHFICNILLLSAWYLFLQASYNKLIIMHADDGIIK